MKILFLGDIVGKPGRKAVAAMLPNWKKEHDPDLVIANGENMAHGSGFTMSGFEEMQKAGVDFFTSGNHWPRKEEGMMLFANKKYPIIRPANWPGSIPGDGFRVIEVGATKVAIINLIGQLFMREQHNSPFHKLDEILDDIPDAVKVRFVDFHGEATSEKAGFGWYADGRVSAVVGTHTHVPTADARLLLKGTAFVTDVGMCGMRDSVIGDNKENRVQQFLNQLPVAHAIDEHGAVQANAVLITVDAASGKATAIERLSGEID
ncbi:MAG: TIGR00282 family metallophosphoesterase, partial [bacterium]|nr:TIGR00282 family metallophosphoesterase [bacterium]